MRNYHTIILTRRRGMGILGKNIGVKDNQSRKNSRKGKTKTDDDSRMKAKTRKNSGGGESEDDAKGINM